MNQDTFVTEILHLLIETFVEHRKSPRNPAEIKDSCLLKDLQDWESFLQGKPWNFQVVPCCSPATDLGEVDNANSFSFAFESGVTLTKGSDYQWKQMCQILYLRPGHTAADVEQTHPAGLL